MRKLALLAVLILAAAAAGFSVRSFVADPGPPPVVCIEICNDGDDVVMYNDFHIYSDMPVILGAVEKPGWSSSVTGGFAAEWETPSLIHFMPGTCDTFCVRLEGEVPSLGWEITQGGEPIGGDLVPVEMAIGEGCAGCGRLRITASPNPANVSTEIRVQNPSGPLTLEIRDILGKRVRALAEESTPKESYIWDGRDDSGEKLSGGIYFYRAVSGGSVRIGRIIIVK